MRINAFIAKATGLSRRAADQAVLEGRITISDRRAQTGDQVSNSDEVKLDGKPIAVSAQTTTIMLNKPTGYVVSRDGQGSNTIYDLLPTEYHRLKPVGRLDKDSSGLLLLTNDGQLANKLTHPRYSKTKIYAIKLNKSLSAVDKRAIEQGVKLDDGPSALALTPLGDNQNDQINWQVTMSEGRNRQIRRTFAARGYTVVKLHRTRFGDYELHDLKPNHWQAV